MKLQDGYYWALIYKRPTIVKVINGCNEWGEPEVDYVAIDGFTFMPSDVDFGFNPQPIEKPEWCK